MGIDIEKFLEGIDKKNNEKSDDKLELNFESDVQKNLSDLEQKSTQKTLKELEKIYGELQNFDENLPNKFLEVEKSTSSTIQKLTNLYSSQYLQTVNQNKEIIKKQFLNKQKKINELIKNNNLHSMDQEILEIKELLKSFPEEFANEKIELEINLKKIEIVLDQIVEKYKKRELKKIINLINKNSIYLFNSIELKNSKKILEYLDQIKTIFKSIPKIIRITLIEEKKLIDKIELKAKTEYQKILKNDFEKRKNHIHKLTDTFTSAKLNKNITQAMITYNEILIEFSEIPNFDIKEKVNILKEITKTHEKLNNLYVTNNMELFINSYNSSKIIEEAKDYIDQIKTSRKLNINNITTIKEKLKKIKNNQEAKSLYEKYNEIEVRLNIKQIKETKNAKQPKHFNENLIEEVKILFKELKNSKNKTHAKLIFKKIHFYINLLEIPEKDKKKMSEESKKIFKEI